MILFPSFLQIIVWKPHSSTLVQLEWDQPAESIHPGSHLDDRLDKTREVCYVLVKRGEREAVQ
jgi:hypothetical protein